VPPVNRNITAGCVPVPSTRSSSTTSRSGAYFFANALTSSSVVPGAMLPIQILMLVLLSPRGVLSPQAMMLTPPST